MNAWALGLDLDQPPDVWRVAALAYQLPRNSRTWRALNPALENGTVEYLLRQVELNQRRWAWAHTKEAEAKTNEPEPIPLPGEEERNEEQARREERNAADIAAQMGLNI